MRSSDARGTCRHTIGVDVDADALERAKANIADYELDIDLVHADIGGEDPLPLRPGLVDTVVMNPPFGTRVKGVDLEFVRRALSVASTAVYSLHKTSTRSVSVLEWPTCCFHVADADFSRVW